MKEYITDEELVGQLQKSFEPKLFALLSERYEKKIVAQCRTYVKDEDTAKDLAQDVFVKLFLKISMYKGDAKFSSWLYTITNNTCLDYLRKNSKHLHTEISNELADKLEEISEFDEEVPEEVSIEILQQLLEQIPPQDKMILMLKYKEHLSLKEIQETMGIGESAVKMRLKRAREKVTKLHKQAGC
ncbi:RNA polymerase sigma factor [Rapidithrix thailandica]|uniref:RNA polymerase sigma factor n=1 Tax=Rapidithrix thailandica TaxID=413964 RepID=A0AAW9S7G1_9BACT